MFYTPLLHPAPYHTPLHHHHHHPPPLVTVHRPSLPCTMHVMQACDRHHLTGGHNDAEAASACRIGARDAYAGRVPHTAAQPEPFAYQTGYYTARACPPQVTRLDGGVGGW